MALPLVVVLGGAFGVADADDPAAAPAPRPSARGAMFGMNALIQPGVTLRHSNPDGRIADLTTALGIGIYAGYSPTKWFTPFGSATWSFGGAEGSRSVPYGWDCFSTPCDREGKTSYFELGGRFNLDLRMLPVVPYAVAAVGHRTMSLVEVDPAGIIVSYFTDYSGTTTTFGPGLLIDTRKIPHVMAVDLSLLFTSGRPHGPNGEDTRHDRVVTKRLVVGLTWYIDVD